MTLKRQDILKNLGEFSLYKERKNQYQISDLYFYSELQQVNSLNSNDVTKNCSAHSVCMQQNENSRWVLIRSSLNIFYASLCTNKTVLALMGFHFLDLFI